VPSLTTQTTKPSILDELRHFTETKVPEAPRRKAEKFAADLEFRLKVIKDLVPKIDQWLASPGKASLTKEFSPSASDPSEGRSQ
jgi:hypothetical protein